MVNGQEEDSGISCIIGAQFYGAAGPACLCPTISQSKSLEIFICMPTLRETIVIRSTFCIFPLEQRK